LASKLEYFLFFFIKQNPKSNLVILVTVGLGLQVMKTFVHFGAPPNILVDGKPHLGTDKLVPLLRNFRHHLRELGVSFSIYVFIELCSFFCSAGSIALMHHIPFFTGYHKI
jgi:hypothetical protein